jgi:hypothetical protein
LEFNPTLAAAQTPAKTLHCRFRGRGNGSSPAPAVSQPEKRQQLDQRPGDRFAIPSSAITHGGLTPIPPGRHYASGNSVLRWFVQLGPESLLAHGGHDGSLIPLQPGESGVDSPQTGPTISNILVGLRSLGTLWWIRVNHQLIESSSFPSSPLVLRSSGEDLK